MFRLFGYAGVGKTTLARHIAEGARGETAFAAFTGKAALVMRSKGCAGASTIHALIYRASEGDEGAPTFTLNHDGPASQGGPDRHRRMLDGRRGTGRDLLSFGKPILVLGDPAQLPPVKGGGFFTEAEPDVMLTEIHRQAEDDPIIRLSADRTRRRRSSPTGTMAKAGSSAATRSSRRGARRRSGPGRLNRTRRSTISASATCGGVESPSRRRRQTRLPAQRSDQGPINGGLGGSRHSAGVRKDFVRMTVRSEDEPGRARSRSRCSRQFFEGTRGGPALSRAARIRRVRLRLRPHRPQGAGFAMGHVMVFDESRAFREHRRGGSTPD